MYCYIASPFFNPAQIERVEYIKSVLDRNGVGYYSPKDECVVSDINDFESRQKCFDDNVNHISEADFIVAVSDGKGGEYYQPDPGTVFECGYAYAKNIPIIYFAETLGTKQFNLMLAQSGIKVCTSREQFEQINFDITMFDLENDYKGSIE